MRRNTVAIQTLYVDVGRTIRLARTAAGIAGGELARRLGVTQTHLQRIETGEMACALHLLVAIADELDTTLDDLVPISIAEKEPA